MECVSFKGWSYKSTSYTSRGLGVGQREEVAVEYMILYLDKYL